MANQGAKKRREENRKHMRNLFRLIVFCNVVYVVVRMLIFHSSLTWEHWLGLFLTSLGYTFPYQQLAKMASPAFDESGELLDGGHDMSGGGVCGYLHDIIYITSFVQLMSIISGKFWYTYLVMCCLLVMSLEYLTCASDPMPLPSVVSIQPTVLHSISWFTFSSLFIIVKEIPAFAVYQLSGLIRAWFSQGSEGQVEDEKTRKKREKMEKKASRPKFAKTRNK